MKNGRYIRIAALVLSLACLCFVFFACKAKECEHVEGEWIIDSAATYQSEGQGHTECTLCGETMRSVELPRLICTHDSETWIVEVEATYETEGQKYCKCDICGTRLASVQIPRRLEESEIVSSLSPFVLSVVCYDYDGVSEISRGSGFIIDGDGTFITNAHVVRGAYYIKVSDHLGATYNVDLLYKYNATTSDYAIGRVKDYAPRFAPEFSLDARVGDTVYALGYAGGSSELSVTRGEITDTAKREGGKYYYANTASIDHGSSGGILADEWGRVIGITTGLAGGDFIAVRYHDFALVLENPLGGGKAPINYFYETRTVTLDANNASEFLDILVHTSEGEGASVTYRVTVKLKDEYKDRRDR